MHDSIWTFAFEVANFVALAGLLGWFFFKPVREAIEAQQSETRRLEEQAKEKLAHAEQVDRDLNQQRQAVAQELEVMRNSARDSADQERDEILTKARAEADRERERIKRQAIQIQQTQARHLAHVIAQKTSSVISKLLLEIDGPELEPALIQAAIGQLGLLSSDSLAPVSVESARALDEVTKARIREALHLPQHMVTFHVFPDLVGGLRITTAQGLVDASVAGLARFAEQELLQELGPSLQEVPADE